MARLRLREQAIVAPGGAADPAAACGERQEIEVEIGDHEHVLRLPGLRDDPAIAIDDHGVAGADFSVILADAVAEQQEIAVVMGPGGSQRSSHSRPLGPRNSASIASGSV